MHPVNPSDLLGNLLAFSFVNINYPVICLEEKGEEEKILSKMTEIMIPTSITGQW